MKTSTLRLLIQRRLLALLLLAALVTGAPARAGVTFDGTMGPTGSLSGNMTVPASVGTQRGANLFHSFGTFNIFTGESLYFTPTGSSAAISNVISRVTGGSGSTIDGVLGSTISGANVFLINPSGIVFGPNAQLDVSGSFYASTANYLRFAGSGRFDATTPGNTVLTVAAPAAFGFLGPTPAAITVNGSVLAVPIGQTLGLIGGDITIKNAAYLAASSGTAHLVSGASAGKASFAPGAFDVSSFSALGKVSLSGGSAVDVSEPIGQSGGGGSVYLRGGKFVLDGSGVFAQTEVADGGVVDISVSGRITLANGTVIDTTSFGAGRAGDINLTSGGPMSVDGSTITSESFGDGNAGNILINAGSLDLANGALITSSSVGVGRGGDIAISTAGTMALDNASIFSSAFAAGDAGHIVIDAGAINLSNGALIFSGSGVSGGSSSVGRGGDITISTPGAMAMDNATIASPAFGGGNAGNILINAGSLDLANGAVIFSSSEGAGRGGDIAISTAGTMAMDNASIFSSAFGDGNAGNILIDAGAINLSNGAFILSSSGGAGRGGDIAISTAGTMAMDNASISSGVIGDGNAGNILIDAGAINLSNSAFIFSSSEGAGRGGDIAISTPGTMAMDNATIASPAIGDGNAGNILINAGSLNLNHGAQINSSSVGVGRGGDIAISTAGTMAMDNATISSGVIGDGDAGNIQIDAGAINLSNGAFILSSSGGVGRGGDITISTPGTMAMDNASIASPAFGGGNAGNILINAGSLDLANGAVIISSSLGAGRGGDITIGATGTMAMDNATISSGVIGDGDAGNILIDAGAINLSNGAFILSSSSVGGGSSSVGAGRGGDITIGTTGTMSIDASMIISKAFGDGDAGNVLINAGSLDLTNGSKINSSGGKFGAGRGGNITINTTGAMSMDASKITSKALGDGDAGNVLINTGNLNLTDGALINSRSGSIDDLFVLGRGGDIAISATGTMSMDASKITSETFGDGNAGSILISAGSLDLKNRATITSAGGNPFFFGRGGSISITATAMSVDDSTITSRAFGEGDAGNILINAGNVSLTNGALINSDSGSIDPFSVGRGGDITISTTGTMAMNASKITSETFGDGDAGSILISAGSLDLKNGATITSAGGDPGFFGRGGNITIGTAGTMSMDASTITSQAFGEGNAGSILINAGNLNLANSAQIRSTSGSIDPEGPQPRGAGAGGNITISTPGTMAMNASKITSETFGDGDAGNILISAGSLNLANSLITSAGGDPGFIGRGGNITIGTPGTMSMDATTITSQAYGDGVAGNILIDAGNLNLANGAEISAKSVDSGNAGDIGISARESIRLTNGSAITTEALFADGGNINLSAGFMIYLRDSRITTSVGTGFGNGGNITIDPVFVILDNSQIIAQAFGGAGGNISIVTQHFITDPVSVVDASSALGVDGNVEISSPNTDIGANLGVLPATLFDASALMRASCAARAGAGAANSFIGVGRGGLPLDPESAAYSTYGTPQANRPAAGNLSGTSVVYLANKGALQDWALASPCRQ